MFNWVKAEDHHTRGRIAEPAPHSRDLSFFCSITIAFKFSNRVTNISNYFHFPKNFHFSHVQACFTHILGSKPRRARCPFTSLSRFPNKIQHNPLIRTPEWNSSSPRGFELSVGLSWLCPGASEQLLTFGETVCSPSNLEKFLPFRSIIYLEHV